MQRVITALLVAAVVAVGVPSDRPAAADHGLPHLTGTISGTVWLDADADGVRGAGEQGLAGVRVDLRNAGVDGSFGTADDLTFNPATTSSTGQYNFSSLVFGTYRATVDATTAPTGTALTTPGSNDNTLTLAAPDATADFGFRWTGSIGDLVWLDADLDGTLDIGETGVSGVKVSLVERGADATFDTADDVTRPDSTSTATGAYGFANLPVGTYRVSVDDTTLPAGTTVGGAAADPTTLTLAAGEARGDVDFALHYTASVGDRVWHDLDADGAQDAGETGIANVTVRLSVDGTAVATTTTGATGLYSFTDLAPGDYRVTVDASTAPAGTALVTAEHVDLTLAPHGTVDTADFGFRWTGTIGDLVWLDADGDGVRDAGEAGIPGVVVRLRQGGAVVATSTTDASGAYAFANLAPGDYEVDVDEATAPAGTVVAGAAADPTAVSLTAGETRADIDFAVRFTGSIGDRVWLDADADGTQDAGETGIAGVTVHLFGPGADDVLGTLDDTTEATTSTDASGAYLFVRLAPGDHRVQIDPATAPDGTAATTPVNVDVDLDPHSAVADADFGFRWTGTIGDRVWHDVDADGAQDAGETGIANVTVRLSVGGTVVATTTTNALGLYSFVNLAPGDYRVTVDASTAPAGTALVTAEHVDLTLAPHGTVDTADFGFRWTGTIGDLVWLDADADGVRDAGENGIAGVTVQLSTGASTVTDASGAYAFANLAPGTYEVGVDETTLPAGTVVAGAAPDPTTVSLGAGEARADVDFAVRFTGSIGDRVWLDADADGTQDAGEAGIANVTVRLFGPGADDVLGTLDDTTEATTSTDASGAYLFVRLAPGDHRVQVDPATAPDGTAATTAVNVDVDLEPHGAVAHADFGFRWTGTIGDRVWHDLDADGAQDAGETGIAGVTVRLSAGGTVVATTTTGATGLYSFADLAPGDYRVTVDASTAPAGTALTTAEHVDLTLAPHGTVDTADFGFRWTGSIGDLVWLDADADGTRDAEENGLANVTVQLSTGATAVTDASGAYAFANLAPGTYEVGVDETTVPLRLRLRGSANPTTVSLGAGQARADVDFAYSRAEDLTLNLSPAQVSTFAGSGTSANTDGTGTQASFRGPLSGGVTVARGAVFVGSNGFLRKVDTATGAVTTIAGSTSTGCGDSTTATSVGFGSGAFRVATDDTYVYSTCPFVGSVRKTSIVTGATSTVATRSGTALTLGPDGFIYLLGGSNPYRTIYRIDPSTGATSTFATLPSTDFGSGADIASDGTALWVVGTSPSNSQTVVKRVALSNAAVTTVVSGQTQLANASGIAVAGDYLYLTQTSPHALVRVAKADGAWAMVAGENYNGAFNDGLEFDAWFNSPVGIASDGTSLWIADGNNHRLRRAVPGTAPTRATPTAPATTVNLGPAQVSTFAGNGTSSNVDGTGTQASFKGPLSGGVTYHDGSLYVASSGYLRKVDRATGVVTTIAGASTINNCTDSATPTNVGFGTTFNVPRLATDGTYLYSTCVFDSSSTYLRRTSLQTGATTTIAPMSARALTLAPDGFLYVVGGSVGRTIYRVHPYTGATSTFATIPSTEIGSGTDIASDGSALWLLATSPSGGVQVVVKRVALSNAAVTTVVSGQAQLNGASGIAVAGDYLYTTQTSPNALVRIAKADGAWAMVAGDNYNGAYNDGLEFDAWFNSPVGIVSDGTSLFVADGNNHRLRRAVPGTRPRTTPTAPATTVNLSPAQVTTFAGNGTSTNADGTGTQASFRGPLNGVAYHDGAVYVATFGYLRKVDTATGAVTTIAGSTSTNCTDSATPTNVGFGSSSRVPRLATDGTYLYSTCAPDSFSTYLRRTSLLTGATTTIMPFGAGALTLAPDGFLYVLGGTSNRTVYRVDPYSGATSTFATLPTTDFSSGTDIASDGSALWVLGTGPTGSQAVIKRVALADASTSTVLSGQAQLANASGIAVAGASLYLTQTSSHALVRVAKADGAWALVAGANYTGAFNDGLEYDAWFSTPTGIVSDGTSLWIADGNNSRLRRATPGAARPRTTPTAPAATVTLSPAQVTTFAGNGFSDNTDGTGTQASFRAVGGVAYHDGAFYVGTSGYLRKVDAATGAVTTIAGSTSTNCTDSATPTNVGFGSPSRVPRLATDGTYLYSTCAPDSFSTYLRRTSLLTGATTTITPFGAGALTLAPDGFLYVLGGTSNRTVYRVNPYTGETSTFATMSPTDFVGGSDIASDATALWVLGSGPTGSEAIVKRVALADASVSTVLSGQAQLANASGIAVAGAYLYTTQTSPNALVRIAKADGTWAAVAGENYTGSFNDGLEFDAWLNSPAGIVSDGTSLWIADRNNFRLRRATPGAVRPRTTPTAPATTVAANPAEVSTFAGNTNSSNVDGVGTQASFRGPLNGGVAYHDGFLYVASYGYLRKVDTATGAVTTIAGSSTISHCADSATPTGVGFGSPSYVPRLATDGTYLYSTCAPDSFSTTLRRTSLLTGATTTITPFGARALTLAPDGFLYVLGGSSPYRTIYRVDPYTGATSTFATLSSADVQSGTDIASDGTALWVVGTGVTSSQTIVKRVALADASVSTVLSGQAAVTGAAGIAVAGSYLYLTTQSSPPQLVRVAKADGSFLSIAGSTPPPNTPTPTYADGIGVTAWLNTPTGIVSDGTRLWFLDHFRLRRAVPGTYPAADGGPTRPGELFGGDNPAGAYDPCACADPVSVETGNFYENYNDLAIPGRGPALAWTRSYNALAAPGDGPLGYGWTHGYRTRLVDDPYEPGVKNVVQENGSQVSFTPGPNGWTAPTRVLATLTTNGDGTYTFVRNKRESFDFTAAGALWRIRDRNGYATTLAYDGSNRLSTITDPSGRTLTLTYNASNRITRVADQTGRDVEYAYDGNGNLTDVTDVKNGNTHYTYDGGHLLLTVRDQRLGVVTNTYDSARRVLTQKDQLNRTTTFAYSDTGTTVTDPRGNVTVYTVSDGLLTSVTRGAGTSQAATTSYVYDPETLGRTATTDPLNHTTTVTYDDDGNVLSETDALNRTRTYTYNAFGDRLTETDASGVTTSMTYDAAGNPLTRSRPLSGTGQVQTTTFTYGDSAHPADLTSTTDANGKTELYVYDTAGYLTQETDALGHSTTYAYDSLGRRTAMVTPKGNLPGADPAQYRTTSTHDANGAVLTATDPLGHVTAYQYDAAGNRTRVTDPDNSVTNYAFDAANRLTTITRADNSTLTYEYDASGNIAVQRDGANRAMTYTYDALNRLSTTTDPLNRVTTLGYDAAGNRTTLTDPDNGATTYAYDAVNRMTSKAYSDGGTVTFGYDALDRRTSMTDGTGTTTYTWDSLSRLASTTNGAGATVGYGWDLANRMTSLTYPGGSTVTRTYDDAGRLASVTDWLTGTTSFLYDANSNLIGRVRPNGVVEADVFDRADRLTSIDHSLGTTSLASFSYGRTVDGLINSSQPAGVPQGNEAYTFNALEQLSAVNGSTFSYDGSGNVTTMASGTTLSYDAGSQLQTATLAGQTTSYGFDSRGNRTSVTPPSGPATSLAYDRANRLVSYGASATYAYNGDGRRTSKTVSGSTTAFVWDEMGHVPLLLKDGTDSYVYGPDGTPLERIAADGTVTYVLADHLGSVRALTNGAGSVVGTFAYDAYGKPTGSTGTVALPFGFAGEYRDAESGLVYLRARYYDPSTAQFLTVDPARSQTWNAYGYADGDPVDFTDALGLKKKCTRGHCPIDEVWDFYHDTYGDPGGLAGLALKIPGAKKVLNDVRDKELLTPKHVERYTRHVLRLIYLDKYAAMGCTFDEAYESGVLGADPSFKWWMLKMAALLAGDVMSTKGPSPSDVLREIATRANDEE